MRRRNVTTERHRMDWRHQDFETDGWAASSETWRTMWLGIGLPRPHGVRHYVLDTHQMQCLSKQ